jgi:hypothetical protein
VSTARQRLTASSAFDHALVLLPLVVTVVYARYFWASHVGALDFRVAYWYAGHQVLHGLNPYATSPNQILTGVVFVYPALAAILFAPFALLPSGAAGVLFAALCIAATFGALRILGVTDRRVYGVVFLWSPVVTGWQAANLTLVLVLGLALAWKYRDRPLVAGALVAILVSIKPMVWPLALWLLVTRRYRATAYAAAIGLALNAAAWGMVGFGHIDGFLRMNSDVVRLLHGMGYGLTSVAAQFGVGNATGYAFEMVIALVLAGACVAAGLRHRDTGAFAACVGLMLAASPVIDFHYFALLIVPLAIVQPRLSVAWMLPLLLWVCEPMGFAGWGSVEWWIAAALIAAPIIWRIGPLRATENNPAPSLAFAGARPRS